MEARDGKEKAVPSGRRRGDLEGKPRTPLSSRVATRVSWSPLSGLKGVQPPLPFGEMQTKKWPFGETSSF